MNIKNQKKQKGSITITILVFSVVFLIFLSGMTWIIIDLLRTSTQKVADIEALEIAEAGINYYRWHLLQNPEDLQDGNAWCCASPPCASCGPYEHDYNDPEGGMLGKFSIEIIGKKQCGQITAITVLSTGWTDNFPDDKKKIKVKYVRPTVAEFAYILNSNVWAGADREINGPYHSNGGIRMDGENNSIVTSGEEDWACTCSFGCKAPKCLWKSCPAPCSWDGTSCTCPGVFTTANGDEGLFDFPVLDFNFDGITTKLSDIKELTKDEGQGTYIAPSGAEGYHIILKEDRSMDVYKVTEVNMISGVCAIVGFKVVCDGGSCKPECPECDGERCVVEDPAIKTEVLQGNYPISDECGLIFIEDNLWVEGMVKGKTTVVSADLIDSNKKTDTWLVGNIQYTADDGSDGLVLLSQHNNLISLYSPDIMELNGIYVAQTGHFGRNYYHSGYAPHHKRTRLEMYGTVVSNGRVGTKWSGGGVWISGYNERKNTYDSKLGFNPPPFLPCTSLSFTFKEWEEVN